jgi:hypothetical protein
MKLYTQYLMTACNRAISCNVPILLYMESLSLFSVRRWLSGHCEDPSCALNVENPAVSNDGVLGRIAASIEVVLPTETTRSTVGRDVDLADLSNIGLSLSSLPTVSRKIQTVVLRKEPMKRNGSSSRRSGTRLLIESVRGDRLAVMDPTDHYTPFANTSSTDTKTPNDGASNLGNNKSNYNYNKNKQIDTPDQRIIRDTDGNLYAVVIRSVVDGRHKFKICGDQPMFPGHRRSRESGFHTYAEAKNWSGLGIRFGMKVRGGDAAQDGEEEQEEECASSTSKYVTESFGPTFLQLGQGRPRGFHIKDSSDGQECARITVMGNVKAISVRPYHDIRLMICFATIIDEMVENRLR